MRRKDLNFTLRLPVVAAPMFLVSEPELVLAARRAGIVGAFPTPNARPIEVLDEWIAPDPDTDSTAPTPRTQSRPTHHRPLSTRLPSSPTRTARPAVN